MPLPKDYNLAKYPHGFAYLQFGQGLFLLKGGFLFATV